jgi:hypothetical protein
MSPGPLITTVNADEHRARAMAFDPAPMTAAQGAELIALLKEGNALKRSIDGKADLIAAGLADILRRLAPLTRPPPVTDEIELHSLWSIGHAGALCVLFSTAAAIADSRWGAISWAFAAGMMFVLALAMWKERRIVAPYVRKGAK